jgi:hypothetical protein
LDRHEIAIKEIHMGVKVIRWVVSVVLALLAPAVTILLWLMNLAMSK